MARENEMLRQRRAAFEASHAAFEERVAAAKGAKKRDAATGGSAKALELVRKIGEVQTRKNELHRQRCEELLARTEKRDEKQAAVKIAVRWGSSGLWVGGPWVLSRFPRHA
jgi:hypothetical protein